MEQLPCLAIKRICSYFDDNSNTNGKRAEACALVILVRSESSNVHVVTGENDLASRTRLRSKNDYVFIAGLNILKILCVTTLLEKGHL